MLHWVLLDKLEEAHKHEKQHQHGIREHETHACVAQCSAHMLSEQVSANIWAMLFEGQPWGQRSCWIAQRGRSSQLLPHPNKILLNELTPQNVLC